MQIFIDGNAPSYLPGQLLNLGFQSTQNGQDALIYYPSGKGSFKRFQYALQSQDYAHYAQVMGTEYMTSKQWLWLSMIKRYDIEEVLKILPETYILEQKEDQQKLSLLAKQSSNDDFILKGRQQQRKSLKIIKGKELTQHLYSPKYVLAQKIIKTSQAFTKRPFHFRLYLIVSIENGQLHAHLFNNGKILYGEQGSIITYNHIEPIQNEPQFWSEIKDSQTFKKVYEETVKKLSMVVKSINYRIKNKIPKHECTCHQLIGLDIVLDQSESVKIIELNLRPDMKAISNKDLYMKEKVLKSYFNLFKGNGLNGNWVRLDL